MQVTLSTVWPHLLRRGWTKRQSIRIAPRLKRRIRRYMGPCSQRSLQVPYPPDRAESGRPARVRPTENARNARRRYRSGALGTLACVSVLIEEESEGPRRHRK